MKITGERNRSLQKVRQAGRDAENAVEVFTLDDVKAVLAERMLDREAESFVRHLRSARLLRLLQDNAAQLDNLLADSRNLTGERWLAVQNKITALLREGDSLHKQLDALFARSEGER